MHIKTITLLEDGIARMKNALSQHRAALFDAEDPIAMSSASRQIESIEEIIEMHNRTLTALIENQMQWKNLKESQELDDNSIDLLCDAAMLESTAAIAP